MGGCEEELQYSHRKAAHPEVSYSSYITLLPIKRFVFIKERQPFIHLELHLMSWNAFE